MRLARATRLMVVLGAAATVGGPMAMAAPGTAPARSCADYSIYSAVALASGVRTDQNAAGLSLVSTVDGSLPAAQAQSDSVHGSNGWAGSPYSSTAADNIGLTGTDANQVPAFAISSYPSHPTASNSTPAWTVSSKSSELSTTAEAAAGGPASSQASTGRMEASATAACGSDASVQAVADSTADLIDIEGVLRVASVHSHAMATIDPAGRSTLDGSMTVEGASVLGQPVGVTDKGLEVGSNGAPLPQDPLAKSLEDAGITVQYVAASKDPKTGEVFAPGLEIDVSRAVQGVGNGPLTTSYTFGRAYARVQVSGGGPPMVATSGGVAPPAAGQHPATVVASKPGPPPVSVPAATSSGTAPSVAPAAAPPESSASLVTERLANWSLLPMYIALAGGALLLLVGWFGLEKIAVMFGWI